jgi:DNA-directed RNA polymerase specialized sigma24 family protein
MELRDDETLDLLRGVERSADVRHALSCLSHVEVAIVALKYGFLYSDTDIAFVLNLPLSAVKQWKREALGKIEERLT